ncbi:MAG: hypothetical protein OEZ55_10440 [Nitrospinota bacterium]|nr:hypothetical protein [Nitrospinota bacterium]MDH5757075.1 hypothetical protein [Nitrospinota bacterium]
MSARKRLWAMAFAAMALAFISGVSSAGAAYEKDLVVGRMKVTLMPEYDSLQVLVIMEGKFADKSRFPAEARFGLPMEVTKLTDVCSLSPGGHHFCQLFDIKTEGGEKMVDVKLPYSDFFIDFQYAPFSPIRGVARKFVHEIPALYAINNLEVHVQKPARAGKFEITPGWAGTYEKEGFEYYKYLFQDIKAGQKTRISVSYSKEDTMPSVEKQYSAMATPEMFSGHTGEILLAVGVLGFLGIWVLRRRAGKKASS